MYLPIRRLIGQVAGMFAVGTPVGVVAEEWFEEAYSVNPPLEPVHGGGVLLVPLPAGRGRPPVRKDCISPPGIPPFFRSLTSYA